MWFGNVFAFSLLFYGFNRASAYDVFAPGILAAAAQAAAQSGGAPPSRRASFRIAPTDDMPQNDNSPSPDNGSPVSKMVMGKVIANYKKNEL